VTSVYIKSVKVEKDNMQVIEIISYFYMPENFFACIVMHLVACLSVSNFMSG
jgi:hypothetical protein